MPLEATMIVVDNSEPSRNGDYPNTRWDAQCDLANLIFNAKTQSNPESSVGLLSMGGSDPEVLTTLTTNPGKILDGLHRTKIRGESHFFTAVSVAALALKHRQNKSQRQRIIVCVCSEIKDEKEKLVKLAKRMKKNNTSIDVVAFGDLTDSNLDKLRAFQEHVNGADVSTLEIVYPSGNLLSDQIVTSPILAGEAGAAGMGGAGASGGANGDAGAAGGANDFEFGVDPNLDPELALVLRMSMEEERERQAREQRARDEAEGKTALESVPEEAGKEGESSETQPLLEGQSAEGKKEGDEGEKKDGEGGDRMDTA